MDKTATRTSLLEYLQKKLAISYLLLDWSRWTNQKVIQMGLIGLPVTRLGILRLTKVVKSIKGIIARLGKRHRNQNKF